MLEALLFATGAERLADLNCEGFGGDKYAHGITLHELNTRLQRTPFELLPVRTFLKRAGQQKRGADGRERRSEMSVWEVLQVERAIVIAVAIVQDEGCVVGHGIVWDAWRRILGRIPRLTWAQKARTRSSSCA